MHDAMEARTNECARPIARVSCVAIRMRPRRESNRGRASSAVTRDALRRHATSGRRARARLQSLRCNARNAQLSTCFAYLAGCVTTRRGMRRSSACSRGARTPAVARNRRAVRLGVLARRTWRVTPDSKPPTRRALLLVALSLEKLALLVLAHLLAALLDHATHGFTSKIRLTSALLAGIDPIEPRRLTSRAWIRSGRCSSASRAGTRSRPLGCRR